MKPLPSKVPSKTVTLSLHDALPISGDGGGHLQLRRGNQHEFHALIPAQGADEGMHRAAEFEIEIGRAHV